MKDQIKYPTLVVAILSIIFFACNKETIKYTMPTEVQNPPAPIANYQCNGRPFVNATLIPIGNLSSARSYMQCASAGNKILFIGGWHSGGNYWNEPVPVDIYDISSHTWSFHSLIPDNPYSTHFRFGAGVASIGNKIFIAGGGDAMGDEQTSRVDIYDAISNTWSVAQLSVERQGLTAASVDNKVLFAGGFGYINGSTLGEFNTVDIYDNTSNTWSTAQLSEARTDLNAITAGNQIYFAGGRNNLNVSKTIDIYDAVTNSWSVSYLQNPRVYMASIALSDKIFWAGGNAYFDGMSWKRNDNVEILDLTTGITSTTCFSPKSVFSGVKTNTHIVFFTGYENDGKYFEIYNIASGQWSTGVLNQKIQGAAICSVNNTIYVAGGTDSVGKYLDILWKLEF